MARKAAAVAVKISKILSWNEFGRRFVSNFWQTFRRLRGKNSSITTSSKDSAGNIVRDEKEILSRWREHFEDLLNLVTATPISTDTCVAIDFGKRIHVD